MEHIVKQVFNLNMYPMNKLSYLILSYLILSYLILSLSYADGLTLISPSVQGLQNMITVNRLEMNTVCNIMKVKAKPCFLENIH